MRRTNLYLDPEKLRALKMLAASEDASVSDLVREAIDTLIARRLAKGSPENGPPALRTTTMLDDVLRRVDAKRAPDLTQDEIDHDVADAIGEARADRASRRRPSPSRPTIGNG
jgi:hypothetical protein